MVGWVRCRHGHVSEGIVTVVTSAHVDAQTLEARKPEELVLENRSAGRRAELLQGCRGDRYSW